VGDRLGSIADGDPDGFVGGRFGGGAECDSDVVAGRPVTGPVAGFKG